MLVSMETPGSITVVIPSLNEEASIRAARVGSPSFARGL